MIVVNMNYEDAVPQALQTDDGGILIIPADPQRKPRYCSDYEEARNFLINLMGQSSNKRINELLTQVEKSYENPNTNDG